MSWVGLGWVSQLMGWVGSGHTKWTQEQLCYMPMSVYFVPAVVVDRSSMTVADDANAAADVEHVA